MSDTFAAIYEAVRSKISNGDIGQAVTDAVREASIGHYVECAFTTIAYDFAVSAEYYRNPSVLYRPTLKIDGNQWCALYGDNLQDGVAGFGDSPELAMKAFDAAWKQKLEAKE